ncbi:MAG: orotidine-5'-phosphate decarboxylase [Desulfobacterales bacterium]|nr:orotidine-5'-phosphate decarboxylase [Desulfobacterales bacterium]
MKRGRDYIVFPLDVSSEEAARKYVEMLSESVGMFKVGLELFIRSGPGIIKFIQSAGSAEVFLDLKLHDIPVTVSRAMERVADLGVALATVHCGESREMLEAAAAGARGRVGVLGVTVLTSVSGEDIARAGFREEFSSDMAALVIKRAGMAHAAGCAGVVCSGHEVGAIKENFGAGFAAVTPGIRPAWEGVGKDDQRRVTTPAQAVKNGSDYLVIGRPIRDAEDPRAAADRIAGEIESAL